MTHAAPPRRILDMVPNAPPGRRRLGARWITVALSAFAVACYAWSYFLPWWHITLFAPQYPKGLRVVIHLTGVAGDVQEISTLNHYIGMAPLDRAAELERHLAAYAVGALGVAVVVLTLLLGKRLSPLLALAGLLFPLGFLADSFYWMFSFGHNLDPHAPLRIKAFTPQLFGEGKIGQFRTFATPEVGFWVALAAAGVLVVAVLLRRRVCADCPRAGACGAVCPSAFIGPGAGTAKP